MKNDIQGIVWGYYVKTVRCAHDTVIVAHWMKSSSIGKLFGVEKNCRVKINKKTKSSENVMKQESVWIFY